MTIATESVNETEIENESRAEDHPRENENRSVNGSENEKEIVATNVETLRIVQGIKGDYVSERIKKNSRLQKNQK